MNTKLSNSQLLDREPVERPDGAQAGSERPDGAQVMDADWLAEVLDDAGLQGALLLLGDPEPHRLEVRVDGAFATVEVAGDLGQPCGVEVAAALVAAADDGACVRWAVALSAIDEDFGADLLVRAWCSDE
ncbi:MAG: hypothetical protein KY462_11800 [Actinobacteria bacterium]|nr:hypothetical protein [Actinomycetota bacterium]